MTAFAVLLGLAAMILAITGRFEQRRLEKQVQNLRQLVFRLQAQTPVRREPSPAVDRQMSAAPKVAAAIQPEKAVSEAPPRDAVVPEPTEPPAAPPLPPLAEPETPASTEEKKQTLQRLVSGQEVEAARVYASVPNHAAMRSGPVQPVVPTPPKVEPKPAAKPKTRKVSFEEILGAGVYIWIGGIALMLAGAFLVKYSFENDLLSVQARLSIAGAFGALLVLSSLWLRSRADKVAAAVCGAGVAVMFATVLSATAYFHVLNPWLGFSLMAVVTAIAVGMSLMHGQFVALLGLVGGFLTPTLISGEETHWGPTFAYLLLLEIGLSIITRKKQWFGLSALTLVASVVTTLAYVLFAWVPDQSHWLVLFVMGTAVVFVMNAAKSAQQTDKPMGWGNRIWLGLSAVGSSVLLMVVLVSCSRFSIMELSALGLLAAGALVLSRLDRRYIALAYLAAWLCGMMLLAWPITAKLTEQVPLEPNQFYLLAIGYGLVFFLGGLLCLWRNARPGLFAWLSAASALVFVLLAHVGCAHHLPGKLEWWMVYTAVAVLVGIAAGIVWRSRKQHGTRLIDAYALMASALATFAIWFGLDHPWVAPAWCGLAVVIAAMGMRLNLRWLLIPTCWLTAGCFSQLIYPGVTDYPMPMRPVFNTMLAHFGLPALGFAAIAWVYHRNPWKPVRAVFQALALLTATVAVSLQIRLGFDPEKLWWAPVTLIEWSTHAGLWLSVGIVVLWRIKQASLDGLRNAAIGIGVIGLITMLLHPLIFSNPLLMPSAVGSMRVLNWLLYIYGLPCVLAFLFARLLPKEAGPFKKAAGGVSFILLFALLTLEVRHGFMGQDHMTLRLDNGIGLREWTTYSTVWMVVSLFMLWISRGVETAWLRIAATVLGWAGLIAMLIGPLFLDNPILRSADLGHVRVLNWLLYIYGVPCVMAFILARLSRNKSVFQYAAYALSFLLLFVLVSMQIRHGYTGSDTQWRENQGVGLHEWATYSVIWLGLSIVLSWIGARWHSTPFGWSGVIVGFAGLTASIAGPLALDNPLFHQADVGLMRVFNWLLYLYGLPCVLAAVLGYSSRTKEAPMKPVAVVVALLLLFAFVSLEVRQGFVGGDLLLDTHPITQAESYGYSLAWVLLALLLLAGGLITGSTTLRYGSLAVMLVAVGKVAIDTAKLQDLWRVLSLLGLGLSLIVLGYVYQRYVFRRPKRSEVQAEEPAIKVE